MTDLATAGAWLRADLRRFDIALATVTVGMAMILISFAPEGFDTGWPEVAAGVGAFVLIPLRRRFPLATLFLAMAISIAHFITLDRPTPMGFVAFVLLASAGVRHERWQAIGLGVLVAAGTYFASLASADFQFADARAVIGIAWTAGAVGIGDATRSWRRYRESAEAQLRAALETAEAQTRQQITEERLGIARELHDLLAHNLSVMNVQTGAALHLLRSDPDAAESALVSARDAGRGVLDELRDLLGVLRHEDDDAPTASLPTFDETDRLLDTVRATGLDVQRTDRGTPRTLAPAVSLAAYRIVQESLTNAAKHGTGPVELEVDWSDDRLSIVASNRVRSGDAADGSGHGLLGMRERATSNGGSLETRSEGDRFVVHATLPAQAAHPQPEETAS